ncbi:DUF4166 domain-containing protein [Chelatococcus sambhunathii]|uniref:DUF4166 domain-containing protein n=1 Tax=Chelatococcus sambhunathii TaxID=363953 RepID=A0ABU1DJ76_9HYPH|nr:DUF4166 domain-containing protein [Chelatococcus sambhunathii]MDR4308161.1 DUF4166 domain-containing protein [Chelatococcus sambhunathii]
MTTAQAPRVLVLGGAGAFGRRLVEGLVATTSATVIVAGRRLDACEALAAELRARHSGRSIEAARLDRAVATAAEITSLDPVIVADAAGPFQGAHLRFACAVISAGRHYVDIADARDFVAAFPALDAEARAAGVVAVTGASSTPAVSHAALDVLTDGWTRVDRVEIAISPGNRAPRGLSVIAAILSYTGASVRVLRDGGWSAAPGWGLLASRLMPGLGRRFLSLCETPDLDLVPARFPTVRTALFRAGLELPILHLGLWSLSLPRRAGLVRDLARFAGPAQRLASLFERFGSDRGGMTVEAEGLGAEGACARARWSLVAEAGDGPNVPILPALSFMRGLLEGRPPAGPGAHVAAGLLSLPAFEAEAARFAIRTAISESSPSAPLLFGRALGPDLARLPEIVRAVHDPNPSVRLVGCAETTSAETAAGRLVARLFGFPETVPQIEAEIEIRKTGDGEIWTRRFGRSCFRSRLSASGEPGVLVERFGPFAFDLAIAANPDGFTLAVEGWRVFGLSAPRRLAPTTEARGFALADGAYGFDVTIALAPFGRLVRYRGRLEPA